MDPKQTPVSTNAYFVIIAVVLFVGFAGIASYVKMAGQDAPVACTLDARICPDGTPVGRIAPNCEFARCPEGTPSPATSYCRELGGEIEILQEEPGPPGQGIVRMCRFSDGNSCEEWVLYTQGCEGRGPSTQFIGGGGEPTPGVSSCALDSDCVPSSDCHPSSCINQNYYKPSGTACSEACLGPLDCGAGSCACLEGRCTVQTFAIN